MKKRYDALVFIGRFQPFHYGHAQVIEHALTLAEKVIVLIGSANAARSFYNPFTWQERAEVIRAWMPEEVSQLDAKRLVLAPLNDHTYSDTGWVTEVQATVHDLMFEHFGPGKHRIGLIGHSKDHSSYYLGLFPQWGSENVEAFTDRRLFNATDVRTEYFRKHGDHEAHAWADLLEGIPKATFRFLDRFRSSTAYDYLFQEHQYVIEYRRDHAYTNAGYEATHTTVDGCVIQSGHVLVVERGTHPGKGLIALPGGFINPNERLVDGMLRELREETKLKVPAPVLRGSIKRQEVFDDPNRSPRGRVFSHTFLIVLPPDPKGLPKVKGSSDAAKAFWVPLAELDPLLMFEDHYFIIQHMTGDL